MPEMMRVPESGQPPRVEVEMADGGAPCPAGEPGVGNDAVLIFHGTDGQLEVTVSRWNVFAPTEEQCVAIGDVSDFAEGGMDIGDRRPKRDCATCGKCIASEVVRSRGLPEPSE